MYKICSYAIRLLLQYFMTACIVKVYLEQDNKVLKLFVYAQVLPFSYIKLHSTIKISTTINIFLSILYAIRFKFFLYFSCNSFCMDLMICNKLFQFNSIQFNIEVNMASKRLKEQFSIINQLKNELSQINSKISFL